MHDPEDDSAEFTKVQLAYPYEARDSKQPCMEIDTLVCMEVVLASCWLLTERAARMHHDHAYVVDKLGTLFATTKQIMADERMLLRAFLMEGCVRTITNALDIVSQWSNPLVLNELLWDALSLASVVLSGHVKQHVTLYYVKAV
jgi:hypothetical protein